MDIELKLSRMVDEFRSAELHMAKDPVFESRETEMMFVLTARLVGYTRANIKIDINEDGSRIAITGEKPVQETIMVGIRVFKKDVVIKRFRKAFKIPEGVVLDDIKAKFNDVDSVLTITMPKMVRGIRGNGIEEVQEEEISRSSSGPLQIADDQTSLKEPAQQQMGNDSLGAMKAEGKSPEAAQTGKEPEGHGEKGRTSVETNVQQIIKEHDQRKAEGSKRAPDESSQNEEFQDEASREEKSLVETKERQEAELDKLKTKESHDHGDPSCSQKLVDQHGEKDDRFHREDVVSAGETEEGCDIAKKERAEEPERKCIICAPIVAGSAILLSLVVFVFHMIRNKNQPGKKRE